MEKLKTLLLFLISFTLPMYMKVNNILLAVYIVTMLFEGIFNKSLKISKTTFKSALSITVFFVLSLIASLDSERIIIIKYLEKYWCLLLIPLLFISQKEFYRNYHVVLFKGLVYGCLTTLIICNLNVFYELVVNSEPIEYIFRWRHLGHEFTHIADTHPAYLGLFICTSVYCVLNDTIGFKKPLKWMLLGAFTVGVFQLASRTALLIYALVWGVYLFKMFLKSLKQISLLAVVLLGVVLMFFTFGSPYLKERVFSYNSVIKDNRIERWQVSYDIFLEHPVFGIGFKNIKIERAKKYIESGYEIAAQKEYNAHNQIFEYLSLNGILGGIVYIAVFIFLLSLTIKYKDPVFKFLFAAFFMANLTESMMVRIQGIEYFALFGSLFLSKYNQKSMGEYD